MLPTQDQLIELFAKKYPDRSEGAWGPRMRRNFGYYNPDDIYEAVLKNTIKDGMAWADIGCGRDIFPSNASLAKELANRCSAVVGIDPDPNIHDNEFITAAHNMPIEEFDSDQKFDIVTFRMVAEHIRDPENTLRSVLNMTKVGGLVFIYTPHKWAPVSIAARFTPMAVHHWVKSRLWDTEDRDTFPVEYRMNTRKDLRSHFSRVGFSEHYYGLLDDCRTFDKFRMLNYLDLSAWKICQFLHIPYFEKCILGVYRRT